MPSKPFVLPSIVPDARLWRVLILRFPTDRILVLKEATDLANKYPVGGRGRDPRPWTESEVLRVLQDLTENGFLEKRTERRAPTYNRFRAWRWIGSHRGIVSPEVAASILSTSRKAKTPGPLLDQEAAL